MAKGRRLTISRSERYLSTYSGHSAPADESEFCEDDVWSVVNGGGGGGGEFDGSGGQYDYYGIGSAGGRQWESPADNRPRIPHVGGLSAAFEESGRTTSSRIVHQFRSEDDVVSAAPQTRRQQRHLATSAPMSVPDWGKILRVDSAESMHDSEDDFNFDDDSAVDPPHEYLARCRKTATTSVFEGVGRTLKGRDMSRLRDAVWSQTGRISIT